MKTWLALVAALVVAGCSDGGDGTDACGDGKVSGSEQCDDGNTADGDGCSAACERETGATCGNGVFDVATETCDDGNTVDGDGCSATCQGECGNGNLDGTEACDDGNRAADDGCSPACAVETGYTCTGEPSDCIKPTGACSDPYVVALANNAGTLTGTGTGDTSTSMDQVAAARCDGWMAGGKDHIWQFTLTDTRDVAITIETTTPFDAVLRLLASACDQQTEIVESNGIDGCSDSGFQGDGEALGYAALPPGTYFIVIDGYDGMEAGPYSFTVSATPTACGNGVVDPFEGCDDMNALANDGCSTACAVEAGYACTGEPSVCGSACGNGVIDTGEECDDDNTVPGDRCSATCTLEFDVAEQEPNDATAQAITATNHMIRGALTAGDVDLYTFTLTAPSTVEIETYNAINGTTTDYLGVGTVNILDCLGGLDTEIRVFDAAGDVTMDATALYHDDQDGDGSCSYTGPNDSGDGNTPNPMQGMLQPGTYTIKVNEYFASGTADYYIIDVRISSSSPPVAPVPGDLVLNEFMAADNMSDTNCDTSVTGTYDEFVELVNVSSKVLDLTGVTIADSVTTRHTFAPASSGSMTLEPGKAVVVWGGGAPACAGVASWFTASSGQLGLNDAGDTITIANAAAVQLIQVTYPAATLNMSSNLSPELTGTSYVLHDTVAGAMGAFSPGKRADGSAF